MLYYSAKLSLTSEGSFGVTASSSKGFTPFHGPGVLVMDQGHWSWTRAVGHGPGLLVLDHVCGSWTRAVGSGLKDTGSGSWVLVMDH